MISVTTDHITDSKEQENDQICLSGAMGNKPQSQRCPEPLPIREVSLLRFVSRPLLLRLLRLLRVYSRFGKNLKTKRKQKENKCFHFRMDCRYNSHYKDVHLPRVLKIGGVAQRTQKV